MKFGFLISVWKNGTHKKMSKAWGAGGYTGRGSSIERGDCNLLHSKKTKWLINIFSP